MSKQRPTRSVLSREPSSKFCSDARRTDPAHHQGLAEQAFCRCISVEGITDGNAIPISRATRILVGDARCRRFRCVRSLRHILVLRRKRVSSARDRRHDRRGGVYMFQLLYGLISIARGAIVFMLEKEKRIATTVDRMAAAKMPRPENFTRTRKST